MDNLLKNYTVRTLTNEDEINLQNNGEIFAKKQMNDNCMINALKQVTSHVLLGSKPNISKNSCWISHSKNIIANLQIYGMSTNSYLHKRNKVALIKNNNSTLLIPKRELKFETLDEFYNINIDEMDKIVLDISSYENLSKLNRLKLLINKNGKSFDFYSRFEGYAEKTNEVISINKISNQDIECIIDILEMDIIYALSYSNYFENIEQIVLEVLDKRKDIENYLNKLNEFYFKFYSKYYEERLHIYDMVREVCINDNLDPLIIDYSIQNVKRNFLNKLIRDVLGYDIKDIRIVEEQRKICRTGNNNFYNYEFFNFLGKLLPYPKMRYYGGTYECSAEDLTLLFEYEPRDYWKDNVYLAYEKSIMQFYKNNVYVKNLIKMK